MRLASFSVHGLFGLFDHEVHLRQQDRATILHGRNGVGKTKLLEMLAALLEGRYGDLQEIPFSKLVLVFDTGDRLLASRSGDERLDIVLQPKDGEAVQFTPIMSSNDKLSRLVDQLVPFRQVKPHRWAVGDEILSAEELIRRYELPIPDELLGRMQTSGEPPALSRLRAALPVRMIRTHRLFIRMIRTHRLIDRIDPRHRTTGQQLAVQAYAQKMAAAIQAKLAEYATLSQSLDRSFPARLLERSRRQQRSSDVAALRDKLAELEKKRTRLRDAGLLAPDPEPDYRVDDEIDAVGVNTLTTYAEDVERKLAVLDSLANRIDMFRTVINRRFDYKQMSINRKQGFTFTSKPHGRSIPLSGLSSGEQHELVLLYQLLFETQDGTLVLIDEPEISMHIDWQQHFLRDYLAIAELARFDMLIATHSADIIHDRWDLTEALQGPAAA